MIYCFMTTIRNFNEVPLEHWKPESGTPTEHTGSPVHQKIHLDEICAGSVPQLTKKTTVLFNQNVVALLYCAVWLMVNQDS